MMSCERCGVEGESIERRMIFHDLTAPLRTDAKFCGMDYPEHQMKESLLCHTGILCVRGYALDYMHLEGPRTGKLSISQINLISNRLESYRNLIPSEFSRQPRQLEVKWWKATEFRQFLLYTGPVALYDVLPCEQYVPFLTLSVVMRIMLNSEAIDIRILNITET